MIIQGGVGISHWRLAQAVPRQGQLGVVSGTALDEVCARCVQDGDPGGHLARARIFADPTASPTGFPFKVLQLAGTLAEPEVYAARPRICDLGYLRESYRTPEGEIGFRCPAEPVSFYVAKGGRIEDTVWRRLALHFRKWEKCSTFCSSWGAWPVS